MNRTTTVPVHPNKITPKQREYIHGLLNERLLISEERDMELRERLMKQLQISEDPEEVGLTKAVASETIKWLKQQPRQAHLLNQNPAVSPAAVAAVDVPAGRYAIENNDGELRFYQVWRPKGPDASKIVRVYVLHGPDESALYRQAAEGVLNKINEAGVRECAIRYGNEIGACSNCGRRLTNTISRELGIGPICGGRMFGDEFRLEVRDARKRILDRGDDPDEEVGDA